MREFWIDVGGTFTDCLGVDGAGAIRAVKILSSGVFRAPIVGGTDECPVIAGFAAAPADFFRGFTARHAAGSAKVVGFAPESGALRLDTPLAAAAGVLELFSPYPAPAAGIRWLAGLAGDAPIGAVVVKLGTTRGTNALLERQGARVVFVTTAGFGDVLAIGTQNRPKLFELAIKKPAPLYERVVEAEERVAADGTVLRALDEIALRQDLAAALAAGCEAVAICFLHGYLAPEHEVKAQRIARAVGFAHVVRSSAVAPAQKIVPRAETTVVDAYLTPVLESYVAALGAAMPEATLLMMSSAGGLKAAAGFAGKDSILSGPAGGVVGVARTARAARRLPAIGFDMGGTSTDVCRFAGRFEQRFEMQLTTPEGEPGPRLVAPMLTVETVAAGGGSVCAFDGVRLTVGPRSAGAEPGPACYGKGGPLTVTDLNLWLGRIAPEDFAFPLAPAAAAARLDEVRAGMLAAGVAAPSREELALGFLAVAVDNMAAPIRRLSLAQGHDPRDHALVSFGGAGGQHAAALAAELGMGTVIVPRLASLLSAYGIGVADVRAFAQRDVVLDAASAAVRVGVLAALKTEAAAKLAQEPGALGRPVETTVTADVRYVGQDTTLTVGAEGDVVRDFVAAHRAAYGFELVGKRVEIRCLRVEMSALHAKEETPFEGSQRPAGPSQYREVYFAGGARRVPVLQLEEMTVGAAVKGPAIVRGLGTSTFVEPAFTATRGEDGRLELARNDLAPSPMRTAEGPVGLSLFASRFTQIAEDMGTSLMRTAFSVNVKERLDFSCALFTPEGSLVVNAPHIPVHLGSMGDTVRAVLAETRGRLAPGDSYVTNDPYRGGSHLPDVTVVTPVFARDGRELLFFTASRAHHAEVGGVTPGSMPPHSRYLGEEGVLIGMARLRREDEASFAAVRALFASGPYPSRRPDDNLADLTAQLVANELGRERLLALVEQAGKDVVQDAMRRIQAAARRKVELKIASLPVGVRERTDALDDGTKIVVKIERQDATPPRLVIDFTGTDPVHPGNFNANAAIVRAATFYALRCLLDEDVPLNEGVLAPVSLIVPEGSFLLPPNGPDPARLAAVVAGNVETSQRLVDVLLGALGLAAASQGTMNNFLFGRGAGADGAGFGYYETIAGGTGATPSAAGAHAVHSHMTNTRITDPEVLEERFPVRLWRFAIRHGSGGRGRHPGGDGIVRELEFLVPLTISLLTSRRGASRPFGMEGGEAGASGENAVCRAGSSRWEIVGGVAAFEASAGDRLRISTPGGGAWGKIAQKLP